MKFKGQLSRNGSGAITAAELGQVMKSFGWNPSDIEVQELISEGRIVINWPRSSLKNSSNFVK